MPDENERHQNADEVAESETAGQKIGIRKRP